MINKTKHYMIVAILIMLIALSSFICFFIGKNISRGESVKQFVVTEDVKRGNPLAGKYKEKGVSSSDSMQKNILIISEADLKDKVASTDLYKNQSLTVTSACNKDDVERNLDFAMPITVEGSIANSIGRNEIVAIKVKYKDSRPDDCIVPSIPVTDIKTSNGEAIKDTNTLPGFLLFIVSNEESSLLNSASKEGSLYIVRYKDLNQPRLERTYKGASKSTSSSTVSVINNTK